MAARCRRDQRAEDRVTTGAAGSDAEPELDTDCETEEPDPELPPPRIVSTTVV